MKRFFLACLAASTLFAGGSGGIPPRPHSTDYPVQRTADGLTLAAALLTPAETKTVFGADLDRAGFLVFEVAAYPAGDAPIEVSPDQFTLPIPGGALLATSSPQTIVETMYHGSHPAPHLPGNVQIYNTTDVGYENGGGRRGGVYAGGATTVGIGRPGPAPTPSAQSSKPAPDRDTLEVELVSREFPNAAGIAPVAGYLYFEKPRIKPKDGVYELNFTATGLSGKRIILPVPAKAAK